MEYRALEYRFFYSHDASVDLACEVVRLELPPALLRHEDDACADLLSSSEDDPQLQQRPKHKHKGWWRLAKQPKEEVFVTAHVTCNGEALHGIPASTCAAPAYDAERGCLRWGEDQLLPFPGVKYRDLAIDARLVLCVWGGGGPSGGEGPLAMAALELFTELGVLRMGKQKLRLRWGAAGTAAAVGGGVGAAVGVTEGEDFGYRLEKAREAYIFNRMPPVDWLDRVTLPYTGRVLAAELAATTRTNARGRRHRRRRLRGEDGGDGEGEEEEEREEGEEEEDSGYLVVKLPMFRHPVLYEEKLAHPAATAGIPPLGGGAAAAALSTLTGAASSPTPASSPKAAALGGALAGAFVDDEQGGATSLKMLNNLPGWELCLMHDCEAEADNPVESKYRKLAHDKIRGGATDPNHKPNKEERARIEALLGSPVSQPLRMEDRDLLWAFRYSLTDNRKALTKFLLSVDWSVEREVQQVPALLEQWRAKTAIDVSDALKLLGREKAFQHEMVRTFAVDALRRASDAELVTYLLQLVQALRYEAPTGDGASASGSTHPDMVTVMPDGSDGSNSGGRSFILARFLIERACGSLELANFLYWYLRVELHDGGGAGIFKAVFDEFGRALREVNPATLDLLRKQDAFFGRVAQAQRAAQAHGGRAKGPKEEKLRRLLAEVSLPSGTPFVPLPLDPQVKVGGVAGAAAFMFSSALYPAVIPLRLHRPKASSDGSGDEGSVTDGEAGAFAGGRSITSSVVSTAASFVLTPRLGGSSSSGGEGEQYKVIFKNGDDLRQDQLVIQMVSLMDFLLKRVNLDLKLTPYRILATGPRDGMMEFVGRSSPVSEVLKKHGSLLDYFRAHHPEAEAPFGVRPDVISTYVKSCAGYSVITYLLGIGDRHLDNILLLPEGHLLHIDFGYIFGNDPKFSKPPPFRLAPPMVEAMGGTEHESFGRFQRYCCQAYNCFREHANLILTLLGLMADAGIKDLSLAGDPQQVLTQVEEKFRLDLNVEQAELFFLSLITESATAMLPEVYERIHKMAVGMRG